MDVWFCDHIGGLAKKLAVFVPHGSVRYSLCLKGLWYGKMCYIYLPGSPRDNSSLNIAFDWWS